MCLGKILVPTFQELTELGVETDTQVTMRLRRRLGEICESSEGRRKEWQDHCHGGGMASKDYHNLQERGTTL